MQAVIKYLDVKCAHQSLIIYKTVWGRGGKREEGVP